MRRQSGEFEGPYQKNNELRANETIASLSNALGMINTVFLWLTWE